MSSFAITSDGRLQPISSHVNDGGTAACWIALDPISGRYGYVTNNLSNSISSYAIGTNGVVSLLNGVAASASAPNDLAVAVEGNTGYLYAVNAGTGTVGAFRINGDGSLTPLIGGSGLGGRPQGLAAF